MKRIKIRDFGRLRGFARICLFLLCLLFPAGASAQTVYEPQIGEGVYVDGMDMGGMSAREARAAITKEVARLGETTLTILIGDNQLEIPMSTFGLQWENTQIVDEMLNLGKVGNIVQRYKDQKDLEQENKSFSIRCSVDEEKVRAFVESCEAYNTEPVDGTVYINEEGYPDVEGAVYGLTLRGEESVERILDAVSGWDGGSLTIELAADSVEPKLCKNTLALVKDVLGSATTDFSSSSSGRWQNVENGCSKIDGSLIYPGESFSVTSAVTPFTEENGYALAGSYEENKVVQSYGGGICQVSTTLYNAVLKAELEVTNRSNHTMIVTYVDPAKDAAIAEGVMDLSFYNNTDAPIYIEGYTYGGTITFVIFGHETRPSNRSIEFVSKVTSTTQPTGITLSADTEQDVGYLLQTQSPHTGYTAELWKNVYIDGVLQETVQINYSYYQAVGTVYQVGVKTNSTALSQAIYAAISSNDLTKVQQVIANKAAYLNQTTTTTTTTTTGGAVG